MLLTHWISGLIKGQSVPSRARRRNHPQAIPVPQCIEKLEQRALLSAIGGVQTLELPSFQVDASSHSESHILVRFKEGAQLPGEAEGRELMRGTNIHKVRVGQGATVAQAVEAFQRRPDVLYAQPDYTLHALGHMVPNDTLYQNGGLWGLNNTGQNSGTADADIDAPEAWHVTTGSSNIVVGVIDTGVDHTHPDLKANIWVNPGEIAGDEIDNDKNGYVDDIHGYDFVNNDGDPTDDNGHGSHVSGTIGASANNGGSSGTDAVGVAWDVSIMGLKFLSSSGSGSSSNAIRALDYAKTMRELYISSGGTQGANVLLTNNSWGGGGYDQALKDAIDANGAAGILFVAAAGNGDRLGRGQDNDATPSYPASYDSANIIAVAATDRNDQYASFSNYGATSVDLAAPGVEIWSTIPFNKDTSDGSKDGYARYNGTSMATPHVSGAVALVWAANPNLTVREVKDIVLSTVDPVSGRDTVTDGRLNAARAVERAAALSVPRLSINDVSVAEGDSGTVSAVFTVTRSGDTSSAVSVAYSTQDGTASAEGDYTYATGTLTFETGVTSLTITVPVNGDTVEESHETFFVNLTSATGATIADGQGVGTILDNDGPAITINDVTLVEGNSGTASAVFTVALSKASLYDLTVNYATADGTASAADGDYTPVSGTLTIAKGSTTGTIAVPVNGDTAYESDESFFVDLSAPSHGALTDAQGQATISNDDSQPVGSETDMYVRGILWSERLYGRWRDLNVTVDVNRDTNANGVGEDSDGPAAGASVTILLIHDSNGDGSFDSRDNQWTGSATTLSDGTVTFTLSKAAAGKYRAHVTDVVYAGLNYNTSLDTDSENPDYYQTGVGEFAAGQVPVAGLPQGHRSAVLSAQPGVLSALIEGADTQVLTATAERTGSVDGLGTDSALVPLPRKPDAFSLESAALDPVFADGLLSDALLTAV